MLCALYHLNRCDVYHCYNYNYPNYHANICFNHSPKEQLVLCLGCMERGEDEHVRLVINQNIGQIESVTR